MTNNKHENEINPTRTDGELDKEAEDSQPVETSFAESSVSIDSLQQELGETQLKAAEYLDGWQRARADFANYRKRVERDQVTVQQNITGSVVKRFIEILDDLDRALKNRPQEGEGAVWAGGIELVYRKLLATLESNGVTLMSAGDMFDPNLHEAITSEDSDSHQAGEIIEVIQQGFMLGDRVLRPALVRVAR